MGSNFILVTEGELSSMVICLPPYPGLLDRALSRSVGRYTHGVVYLLLRGIVQKDRVRFMFSWEWGRRNNLERNVEDGGVKLGE